MKYSRALTVTGFKHPLVLITLDRRLLHLQDLVPGLADSSKNKQLMIFMNSLNLNDLDMRGKTSKPTIL